MQTTLAQAISSTIQRIDNLDNMPQGDSTSAQAELDDLVSMLPSGSGIDCGTKLADESTPQKLVLIVEYHRMDENGFYCGWNTYQITVVPTFQGIDIDGVCTDVGAELTYYDEETGEEIDDSEYQIESTLDYLCDTYHHVLTKPIQAEWNKKEKRSNYTDIELE